MTTLQPTSETTCDVPGCDQPAVELHANDEPLLSPEYAERLVCRWHRSNPFPDA